MYKALTIAGSDTSGGAGLEADLKTFQEHSVYGMAAITVIVAQNPKNNWAHDVYPVDLKTIEAQIDTVLGGIGVDALKTGMLPSEEIIRLTARKLREYGAKNIVIDPVMVCKGTDEVVNPVAADAIKTELLPLADIVTPNIFEAAQLSGIRPIDSVEKVKEAAKAIYELGAKNVLIKGGKKLGTKGAVDVFFDGKDFEILESPMIETTFTHGAGCTTAAAITANLAKGASVKEAVHNAKDFITAAIEKGFRLNQYVGPVWHGAHREKI
ncbi:MAG: pyridoxine/pyridoxal/pyridoxamine kinase [Clostridiales bacterium]|jgi:pyridoxine kinase|nr:pyridoxine/pyridoxal/pyridoxamine kinase [Clostridiales bacterium]HOA33501.1 pyridoxine/pyridoxal/pyridoxamine kinase [Clostridiales bacterium]HOL78625.1 pyridoxine/pyridoxal/pyridoxamine kinase [Clostridiales bacterium]HQD72202.1 pyridoxine/pyridoxal/pyridoxamine kinase [Clostridiales bacterium]